jgi:DNA-binding transcriptional LysR family regulator
VEPSGRGIALTVAGQHLANRATVVLNELDDIQKDMLGYASGERGRVRLGATRTVGGYALPRVLAAFHAKHPEIEVTLAIDNTRAIEQLLLERVIDLAVVEWQVQSPELISRPLRQDSLLLVASPQHPLASRDHIRSEDLRGQTFVLREPGSGTRALAEAVLGPVAHQIKVALQLDQPEAIVRAVEAGLGMTFISQEIVAGRVAAGTLRVLPLADVQLTRDFSLVTLRRREPSAPMRAFSAVLTALWAPNGPPLR